MKPKMKKIAMTLALMTVTGSANAALVNGSILNIGEGSFFDMGPKGTEVDIGIITAPGFDGQFITGYQGLVLGTVQTPSGSHSGAPDGSESPTVDNPWLLFGITTGMHGTESASNVLSASGNTATVDLSGWVIAWNGQDSASGVATIPMGTGAWFGSTVDGVAQVTCGFDCGDGDSYSLIYSATVPREPNSCINCSPTLYLLNLTGTISAVPVPAAVWLFGSGMIGLVGVARRRKAA